MSTAPDFISVSDLGKGLGHEANVLRPTTALAGRSFPVHYDDGERVDYEFSSDGLLSWTGERPRAGVPARTTSVREGVYFVDALVGESEKTSVTHVVDLTQEVVTRVVGTLPAMAEVASGAFARIRKGLEPTAVTTVFTRGGIGRSLGPDDLVHRPTDELIGMRNRYTYTPQEQYEHIYLNENYYTWHCLEGLEKGLADTDRCHYYKIAEKLYLFVWREKIVPTLGVILIDLDRLRTDGKLFGNEDYDLGRYTNFPVGAHAEIRHVISDDRAR